MKTIAIIPARYASTRFPGKPLAMLGGKPVVQRVYEKVAPLVDMAVVATDDARIYDAVEGFNGRVVMTSPDHKSGTDRVQEAYTKVCEALGVDYDVIINVQGDEPFIAAQQIQAVKDCFMDARTDIATLVKPFHAEDGLEALLNPNSPKVVLGAHSQALYFSRSVIPYLRGVDQKDWLTSGQTFYKHIGLYAYRPEALSRVTAMPQTPLEKAESLEQLRWLENGMHITVRVVDIETVGIDTPQDLERAEQFLMELKRAKGSL
ncbi:MAG: 3-deoxy-manno-octulosonate cytidylyltransferase [Bacteroidales bacterium]|nr:3-deoxy-manno-octulosonate cytidylyltransferase [Candidatus Liminaster caballi]